MASTGRGEREVMHFKNITRGRWKKADPKVAHVFKGRDFEQEVALWLKSNLNCSEAHRNERVQITQNARPYECDVHALKGSSLGHNLRRAAGGFFLIALLPITLKVLGVPVLSYGILFLLASIVCLVLSFLLREQREQHLWVECKNLKGNVNRDQINKVVMTVNLARQSQNVPWKPDVVLFFSATDYDRDALYFAKRNHITCYRKVKSGFKQVT